MKIIKISLLLVATFLVGHVEWAQAKENTGQSTRKSTEEFQQKRLAAGCAPASAQVDLDVNNVRARIMNGGDMWWDLVSTARYEIPKVTDGSQVRRTSLFAGALWIGGLENNNLKLAAMTYRQSGNDFFPGPLDTTTATIDAGDCKQWDKIWEITREEIDNFRKDPINNVTEAIRTWPAHGLNGFNPGALHSHYLAPYFDADKDGIYDWQNGDYPLVFGDQTLWYVYNDKGNTHTETSAESIGLELQTQAFAFATNDEVNDMTFYTTTITNRSKNRIDSCYFGQWVDADLGYAFDDYVGVDTVRSLGFCYNGDNNDEGVFGYGANPPSIGVDFFEGPRDDKGKELPMGKFVYYNNDFTVTGNPNKPIHFYYYLTGRWTDGDPITFGGSGRNTGSPANYMFPGDPSKGNQGGWTEVTAGNKPGDRRFLQSAGAFSLKPGAKNRVTVGVVWARATTGGATGSFDQLRIADDKAQKLYNNDFQIVDGPDAPDVTIRELDRKLILSLENTREIERYVGKVINTSNLPVEYKFQGYQIYQLANSTVTQTQLDQADKARLIAQVDLNDQVTDLVNIIFKPGAGNVPVPMVQNSENDGIRHTFPITTDAFASGDNKLVNYKFYYFMVISYANTDDALDPTQYLAGRRNIAVYTGIPHKNSAEFGGTRLNADYGDGPIITRIEGNGNGGNILDLTEATEAEILRNNKVANPTYKGGRGPVNIKVYDPTKIINGQFEFRLTDTTLGANVKDGKVLALDPKAKSYSPAYLSTARWILNNLSTGETIRSDTTIDFGNEQLIYTTSGTGTTLQRNSWGLAINVKQVINPGVPWIDPTNGFLEATIDFADGNNTWLTGVRDAEHATTLPDGVPTPGNWIRSGKYGRLDSRYNLIVDDAAIDTVPNATTTGKAWVDPSQVYEVLLDGIIAPAALTARSGTGTNNSLSMGPVPGFINNNLIKLNDINSVDIVFTSDKDKWSKCIVLEMGEAPGINQGGAEKFSLRKHDGWDKQVDASGNPVYSTDPNMAGRSWFPGYAINVETGERLNIFFSEDSHLPSENGADMIWNPTSNQLNTAAGFLDYTGRYLWGGKHYIYVMNSTSTYNTSNDTYAVPYDGCQTYYNYLTRTNLSQIERIKVFGSMIWVMEPLLADKSKLATLNKGIVPTETRIRLRVAKPYVAYNTTGDVNNNKNNNLPLYAFATDNIIPERTQAVGTEALKEVNITPNPYYAVSAYETNQLDNRVRIINLPSKCKVQIFTIEGTVVRSFNKDESNVNVENTSKKYPTTFIDWDLKNQKGIPVASGIYIVHVDGYELGEKTLKWFGIMKPVDLDTF